MVKGSEVESFEHVESLQMVDAGSIGTLTRVSTPSWPWSRTSPRRTPNALGHALDSL